MVLTDKEFEPSLIFILETELYKDTFSSLLPFTSIRFSVDEPYPKIRVSLSGAESE